MTRYRVVARKGGHTNTYTTLGVLAADAVGRWFIERGWAVDVLPPEGAPPDVVEIARVVEEGLREERKSA